MLHSLVELWQAITSRVNFVCAFLRSGVVFTLPYVFQLLEAPALANIADAGA